MKVESIEIRKVLLTNGKFGLEVEINGKYKGIAPIGTSRGKHEAKILELERAINKFHIIKRHFKNQKFEDINDVDDTLKIIDGTEDFSFIGSNISLAISYAFLNFFAREEGLEPYQYLADLFKTKPTIPKPVCNMAGGWKGQTNFQEFLVLPREQESIVETLQSVSNIYYKLADELRKKDPTFSFARNLESGWITKLDEETILEILDNIAKEQDMLIGIDVAASNIWKEDEKIYSYSNKKLSKIEQLEYIQELAKKFRIHYIEDPFEQEDFISHSILTKKLTGKLIVGDDLYTTNIKRLKYGIEMKATNACIVKPNQIGTVSDAARFLLEAKKHNMKTIVSHRSVETDDAIIAHIAVGLASDYVKFGFAGERIVKLNELIRLEEKLL